MSAGQLLQTALTGRLRGLADLSGVFDGPPARSAYPYVVVDCGDEADWGTKDLAGREVAATLTLWDDQPGRLQLHADAVEEWSKCVSVAPEWKLVSWRLIRRRVLRDVNGPWATVLEFRARMLALP